MDLDLVRLLAEEAGLFVTMLLIHVDPKTKITSRAPQQQTAKGKPKIVRECTLPLTSARPVDTVVTDMAVLKSSDQGLVLKEVAPGVSVDEVVQNTEAELIIPDEVRLAGTDRCNLYSN